VPAQVAGVETLFVHGTGDEFLVAAHRDGNRVLRARLTLLDRDPGPRPGRFRRMTSDGDEYGTGSKEFALPDDGLNASTAPLVRFIKQRHGIQTGDVDFEALASVEGTTAPAELNEDGDVKVGAN